MSAEDAFTFLEASKAAVTKTRCQPDRGATGSSRFSRPWSSGVESSPHAKPAPCSKCHQHARGPPHVNVNANAIASRSSSSSSTTCPDDSRGIPRSKPDKHSDFNGRRVIAVLLCVAACKNPHMMSPMDKTTLEDCIYDMPCSPAALTGVAPTPAFSPAGYSLDSGVMSLIREAQVSQKLSTNAVTVRS